jgi:hypothetical protein
VELRLALLGEVQITRGGEPVTGFSSAKTQAPLCYLAVADRIHQRSALAGLLRVGELLVEILPAVTCICELVERMPQGVDRI